MDFDRENPPSPEAVLKEYSDDYYHIYWKLNRAGVVATAPGLVKKDELAKEYRHVVEAWQTKQHEKQEEGHETEQNLITFGRLFYDFNSYKPYTEMLRSGVACDQSLRPGMRRHWGELRKCKTHSPGRPNVLICKGCRVSHYAQESRIFDRQLIMARGARVSVCEDCAKEAVDVAGYCNCVCDSQWTCFRCREAELEKLAMARKEYTEGHCRKCSEAGYLMEHVDFCILCRGWRVYEASNEVLQGVEDNDEWIGEGRKEGG